MKFKRSHFTGNKDYVHVDTVVNISNGLLEEFAAFKLYSSKSQQLWSKTKSEFSDLVCLAYAVEPIQKCNHEPIDSGNKKCRFCGERIKPLAWVSE